MDFWKSLETWCFTDGNTLFLEFECKVTIFFSIIQDFADILSFLPQNLQTCRYATVNGSILFWRNALWRRRGPRSSKNRTPLRPIHHGHPQGWRHVPSELQAPEGGRGLPPRAVCSRSLQRTAMCAGGPRRGRVSVKQRPCWLQLQLLQLGFSEPQNLLKVI